MSVFEWYLSRFKWYRKLSGGTWYMHKFTRDAMQLTFCPGMTWWARYPKINRYSEVICTEIYAHPTNNLPKEDSRP